MKKSGNFLKNKKNKKRKRDKKDTNYRQGKETKKEKKLKRYKTSRQSRQISGALISISILVNTFQSVFKNAQLVHTERFNFPESLL